MTSSDCWWCFSILGSSFYNSSWVFKFKRNKCHFSEGKWCWLIEAILTWTQWEIQMFALRKQSSPSFEFVSCGIAPLKLMWLVIFSLGGRSVGFGVHREKTAGWHHRGGARSQWSQGLQNPVPVFTGPCCWPTTTLNRQRWSFTGKADPAHRHSVLMQSTCKVFLIFKQ